MVEPPNATLYARLLRALQSGDLDDLKGLIAPDIVWHEAGNPKPLEGRDAVLQRLTAVAELDNELDIHDILADDEHVVALVRATLRKPDGSRVEYPAVEVAHVVDGVVTERWAFLDAVPADVDAFFADL